LSKRHKRSTATYATSAHWQVRPASTTCRSSKFLTDRFGHGPVTLSRLSAGDVVRFVQRQAPRLHLKRAKLLTTALRSFLRYARYRGDVALDLAAAVPTVCAVHPTVMGRGCTICDIVSP